METGHHLEPTEGWGEGSGAEWAHLQSLLDLVRRENRTELSPERRDQIRERVLERWERYELRRRRVRALVGGVSAMLLIGLVIKAIIRTRAA